MNPKLLRLRAQLKQEKEKNKRLRERLASRANRETVADMIPAELARRAAEADAFRQKNFISYLIALIRRNTFYRTWKKYIGYFRRLTLVSTTLQIIGYIFTLVQTGTVFFLALTAVLISLPLLIALSAGTYLVALCRAPRDTRILEATLADKRILAFFPSRGEAFSRGNFWKKNILSLSNADTAILLVTPYFFAGKGLHGKTRFYLNFKEDSPGIYLIRRYYFFSLRRLLRSASERVTLIY